MTKFHKYTCIRFVPWVPGETMAKYGLTEESHLTITKGSGCAAVQGNYHDGDGQFNSCCGRRVCIHELGHSLGLWHEHQNPWRESIMKLDRSKISGGAGWTYNARAEGTEVYQYDTTNPMHYGGKAFKILYEDLRPLITFNSRYYMYKDVSLYHQCKELYCSNFTDECHNGGFVTLVDDQCSCLCPPGLDPSTGCATTITQVPTSAIWPAGSFALFSASAGCPGNNGFSEGSWQHEGAGSNRKSDKFNLAGSFEADVFRYKFCVKESNSDESVTAPEWDPGRYCILRVNGICPSGFNASFIQFNDAANSTGQADGSLPDGQFVDGQDTRMEFCCRDDGFRNTPLNLPNTQPFVLLLTKKGKNCQEVAGMHWTEEYMWFDSLPDNATMSMNGSRPYVTDDTKFKIFFCHYVPVDFNCGGEITLTKNNPSAVITSPNFPLAYGTNMECNWLIKAGEEGGQVLLNVDELKISSNGRKCLDSLEIRYNLPGQPGLRYCGDGLSRTIRSLNDTVILTLRTDDVQVPADTGFNLTVSLYVPEDDGCYDPATKGTLYRGQRNFTRSMKACLPWSQVTNCPYHAFHPRDFGSGLDENYCRNPDNTAMPWCYTDTEDCKRDFCDVCNIERIYDRSPVCSGSVCQRSVGDIIKAGCAASCGMQPPLAPVRDAECDAPVKPSDASYDQPTSICSVGTTVTLRCATGSEHLNLTCLSDGQWSPAGYVCGACADGWAFYNGGCYKYFDEIVTFSEAQQTCAYRGAKVSSMKNKEEQTFVSSLRQHLRPMWIGATDKEVEGEFRWEDGTLVDWFNWDPDNTPNNYWNQDCVEAYVDYYNVSWNDIDCDKRFRFVCKYSLSERTLCADRHGDCRSVLLTQPDVCIQQPVFAQQMCPYSCGVCLPDDTPQCTIPSVSTDVVVVSPQDQQAVPRGAVVQFACRDEFVLTEGQLSLACGQDGNLIGTLPVCKDPDTIIQDSSDVELVQRPTTTSSGYCYTSLGSNLAIQRNGVIKQWKFYSSQVGFTFFQVWRPTPEGGNFSLTLVGQSQVQTSGQGEETYDLDEADWITVQPGDRIGLFEAGDFRGLVPYTWCNNESHPGDYGVMWSVGFRYHSDFSPSHSYTFDSGISCRRFSFRAVIHPVASVPAEPDLPTSQVPLVSRSYLPARKHAYLGDSDSFYIPAEGYVKEWQFFARHGGTGAFQVWRRREDEGERKYELIGQNKVNITSNGARLHSLEVPATERIAVRKGDIIGFLFGKDMLGIPYTLCSQESFPEYYNIYWFEPLTPESALVGEIYGFTSSTGSWLCRIFSFRAIVEQAQLPTEPPQTDVRTSNVGLISRSRIGAAVNVYLGDSNNFYIPADGYVKEWQFFTKHAGTGAFQVWRRRADIGVRRFELIGQNEINITSNEARPYMFSVPEGERIAVHTGDIIGFLYGKDKLGIPYSFCNSDESSDSNNIYWFEPLTPDTAFVGDVYGFSYSGGNYLCRVFSFRAVVEQAQLPTEPPQTDVRTSNVSLISRSRIGAAVNVYLGDSNNFYIPADGYVKEWQFFTKHAGTGAFQVWRRRADEGVRRFELIGQNEINITSNEARPYKFSVPEGERIAVHTGDIIGFLYGKDKLGIPYSLCNSDESSDSNNIYWFEPLTPDTAVVGKVYGFSYTGGSYLCRVFSLRAVITP
ncbi:uncharacterized protein LOC143297094 [Babylonia areolata]|uniref:uncharacterized protein LOC143297094 n=1 Tax=Babylonia areolata TaxID=304850 RepID=UPI003FD6043D